MRSGGERKLVDCSVEWLGEPVFSSSNGLQSCAINRRNVRRNERRNDCAYLDIDQKTFDRSERVVGGQMKLELFHQHQLIVEHKVFCFRVVALHVRHELLHGHVEFLHLAGQVHAGDHDLLRVVVHHRVVQIEALHVLECGSLWAMSGERVS